MADISVKELNTLYTQAKSTKQRLESDWFMNLSYFAGDQWIFWNNGMIDRPNLEDWRITLTDNRILPIATARVAKKVKNRPIFSCIPFSYDDEDVNAAEIGEKVLENDWNKLSLSQKLWLVQTWTEICGSGFWKVYWDSTKGKKQEYVVQGDGQPYRDGKGALVARTQIEELGLADQIGQGLDVKPIGQGNVCVDVLSPFELFPDPLANTIDECEWFIEEKVRSVEYVKTKYGIDAKPDASAIVGVAESRFAGSQITNDNTDYKGVKVREFYAHDSSKYRGGASITWINDKKVKDVTLDKSSYVHCPYVMFTSQPIPGRFWPTSVTTQLRGPQTDLNKIKSQIRENAIRIGNASILLSRQANVEVAGVPGEEIWFDDTLPNSRPQYLEAPSLPGYVLQEVDRIETSITEISGIHDVSKAMVPTGVTAASAINLLQEADDTRLGPEIANMEESLSIAGDIILKLRAKFNSHTDIIQIVGEDGDVDIQEYQNTMLKDNTNVEVQAGSTMPRSKAAQQAAMTEILNTSLQYGLQPDPRMLRKFLRDYGVGSLEKLFADLETDEMQVVRENRIMLQGKAIDINNWDDDDYHIAAHEEKQKSAKFAKLDPKAQEIMQAHVDAHKERRQTAINAEVAANSVPVGPDGKPLQTMTTNRPNGSQAQ
jgi:hypothetical protein